MFARILACAACDLELPVVQKVAIVVYRYRNDLWPCGRVWMEKAKLNTLQIPDDAVVRIVLNEG